MGALDRYLLLRFASVFALVFGCVIGLAAALDTLANADQAIRRGDGLGPYVLARLPLLVLKLTPIAALLAALVTLLSLSRSGELGAAGALGAGQGRTARALAPAALLLGLGIFAIAEVATPPAAAHLRAMGLQPFAEIARPADAVWLREEDDIIRIGRISADEQTLGDVSIFRRRPDGRLAFEVRAETAERNGDGWRLRDVVVLESADAPPQIGDLMDWPTPLGPGSYKLLAAHPQELPLASIRTLAAAEGASPKPPHFYNLWIKRKYAVGVSVGLMVMLAIPFAGRLSRGRSQAAPLAIALAVGFAYVVFESLSVAAAETGAISPMAGAWGPPIALALMILTLIAFRERPG